MTKFVCPECGEEITGEDMDILTGKAVDHMREEHEKEQFSARYARENIKASS